MVGGPEVTIYHELGATFYSRHSVLAELNITVNEPQVQMLLYVCTSSKNQFALSSMSKKQCHLGTLKHTAN